jgi:hypothetical protein
MKSFKTLLAASILSLSIQVQAQWTACTLPTGAIPFSLEIKNDTIYLGTANTGMYRSVDSGNNWVAVNNGLTSTQIWTVNAVGDALFASSTGGNVFKSTDGGSNWTLSNTGVSSTTIVRKLVSFNGKIFATTTNTGVLVSSDNGSSWAQQNTGIVGLVADPIAVIGSDLYVGVNQKIYKYDSANQAWLSSSNGLFNNSVSCIGFTTENLQNLTMYAGTSNANDIGVSVDGGNNWTVTNSLPSVGVWSLLGINQAIFAGNDYGVYQSFDHGTNWTDISGFSFASPAKFLTKSSSDLYVLQGAKLYKRSISTLGLTATKEIVNAAEVGIFPNPVNDRLHLSSSQTGSRYEVVDHLGRSVLSGNVTAQSIDMSTLAKGVYTLFISSSNSNKQATKFVKD